MSQPAQTRQHLDAGDVGQAEVEDHHVGFVLGRGAQRAGAGRRGDDLVAPHGQVDAQRAQDLRLVVDHQHAGHWTPCGAARSTTTVSPPPGVSLAGNRAAHRFDEAARHRHSQTHPGGVVVIAEPLEGFEDLILGPVRDPGTLVDDVDQHAIAHSARVDPNHAVGRVAQRVVDQVGKDSFQQPGVGHHHGVTDVDLDAVDGGSVEAGGALADADQRALHRFLQVHPAQLRADHAGGQTRRIEQVADQRGQLVDRLLDGGQQFGGVLGGEGDVLGAQAGHRDLGRRQRRAQVVADRREQGAPQLVGLHDRLGPAGFFGQLALPDQTRGLLGHRAEHPAVTRGKLLAGQQHPELVVADLDRGVGGIDGHTGIFAHARDDVAPSRRWRGRPRWVPAAC